jgi:hypothetical protein
MRSSSPKSKIIIAKQRTKQKMIVITTLDALQWAGCATGVAGSLLLGIHRWLVAEKK